MSEPLTDVQKELRKKRFEFGLFQDVECSDEDTQTYKTMLKNGEPLPEGVAQYKDSQTGEYMESFYTVRDSGLTDAEKQEYLKYVELSYMKTIKNCVVFLTSLVIISLILTFIALLTL